MPPISLEKQSMNLRLTGLYKNPKSSPWRECLFLRDLGKERIIFNPDACMQSPKREVLERNPAKKRNCLFPLPKRFPASNKMEAKSEQARGGLMGLELLTCYCSQLYTAWPPVAASYKRPHFSLLTPTRGPP